MRASVIFYFTILACMAIFAQATIPIHMQGKILPTLIGIGSGVGGSLVTAGALGLTLKKWAEIFDGVRAIEKPALEPPVAIVASGKGHYRRRRSVIYVPLPAHPMYHH